MSLSSHFNILLHLQGWMMLPCKTSCQEINISKSKIYTLFFISKECPDNTRKSRQKKFLAWQVSQEGMSQFFISLIVAKTSLKQHSICFPSQ